MCEKRHSNIRMVCRRRFFFSSTSKLCRLAEQHPSSFFLFHSLNCVTCRASLRASLFIDHSHYPTRISLIHSISRKARGHWPEEQAKKLQPQWPHLLLPLPVLLSRRRPATLSSSSTSTRPRRPATTSWSSRSEGTTTGPRSVS